MNVVLKTLNGEPIVAGGIGTVNGFVSVAVVGPASPPTRKTIPIYEMKLDNNLYNLLKKYRESWDC